MVDDEFHRDEGIDLLGVAAQRDDRVSHRREVDDRGHAGEVLHEHSSGREGDLARVLAGRLAVRRGGLGPARERLDVLGAHLDPVLVAQEILEQDLDRKGKALDAELGQTLSLQ